MGTPVTTTSYPQQIIHERPVPRRLLGKANGVAQLDSDAKIPAGQLPASVFGGLSFRGTWEPFLNTPDLNAAETTAGITNGSYYVVKVTSSPAPADTATVLNSAAAEQIGGWLEGDIALWTFKAGTGGGKWVKLDAGNDRVVSVNGKKGEAVLALGDLAGDLDCGRLTGTLQPSVFGVGTITGDMIADGALTAAQLRNGSISWGYIDATNFQVPRANLSSSLVYRASDGKIAKADLPADITYLSDIPPEMAGFRYEGTWDPLSGLEPANVNTLVNGSAFVVTRTGRTTANLWNAVYTVESANITPIKQWRQGDLAVWVMRDSVPANGFWVKIEADSVSRVCGKTPDEYGNVTLGFADFLDGTLPGSKLGAKSIAAANIADEAITGAKIKPNSIPGDCLVDGIVMGGDMLVSNAIELRHLSGNFKLPATYLVERERAVAFWPSFEGATTRVVNYDCQLSQPTEYPVIAYGGAGEAVYGVPRTCYKFLNAGAGLTSTNHDEAPVGGAVEPLPVLGSICLRHVLPESFTDTTGQKVGVYLNAYVPAAAAIKMTIYDSRGIQVKEMIKAAGDSAINKLRRHEFGASIRDWRDAQAEFITYASAAPSTNSYSYEFVPTNPEAEFYAGGDLTIHLECQPAPAAPAAVPPTTAEQGAIKVECLTLRYFTKTL